MTNKQKIRIEVIPENEVNINELRELIHESIKSLKVNDIKQCKTVRSWTELIKDDKK